MPGAGDTVTITTGDTVTIDTATAACTSVAIGTASGTATLTFATTGSPKLTVSGSVSVGNATNQNRDGTITFTSGSTLVCGSMVIGTIGNQVGTVNLTSGGMLSIAGKLSFKSSNAKLNFPTSALTYSAAAGALYFDTTKQTDGTWGVDGSGAANINTAYFSGASGVLNASPTATLDHFALSTISSPKTAGTAITGITLTAQDIGNNTVTGFTGTVAYSGTAGITGTSAAFSLGQLTSVSVTPIRSGSGMTFIVAGSTKTGTATFDVNPGAASKLVFTTQPSTSTVAGVAFAQQAVVKIEDASGNVVTSGTDSTVSVTLTLSTGTGILGGTVTMNAVAGVADFSGKGLNINQVGSDKVLTATATVAAGTKTTTTSPALAITKATPSITGVTSQSINYGTASVTLSGTVSATGGASPVYAVSGTTVIASINGHVVNGAVNNSTGGFSITYNDATLRGDGVSGSPYTITYACAGDANLNAAANNASTSLTVTKATLTIAPPSVAAKDYNASATAGAVTVGTLSGFVGSETVTATGTAADYSSPNAGTYSAVIISYALHDGSFGGLAANYSLASGTATGVINKKALSASAPTIAAKSYNRTATAGAVTVGTLSGIVGTETVSATATAADYSSINAGTYTGIVVTYTLANGMSGGLAANYSLATGSSTGTISAKAIDVTAVSASKTADGNTSSAGAPTISPALVVGDTSGLSQAYDTAAAGTGKTLTPSGGVNDGNSGNNYSVTFHNVSTGTITATAASKLVFTTQPVNTTGGSTLASVVVQIEDTYGNAVAQSGTAITLGGVTLFSGTNQRNTDGSGKAIFNDLVIRTAATGLQFAATGGSLTGASSSSFDIPAAAASKLVFTTGAVTSTVGAASGTITVQRLDAYNNPNTTDAARTVTLVSNSSGVAIFTPAGPLTIQNGASTASFTYTDSHAGTPTITAASTAPTSIPSGTQQETVGKADQTISFTLASPVTNPHAPLSLSATASSALSVTFTSSSPSFASVAGTTLSIHQAGTLTVSASQAGDDNYNAATSMERTLHITGVGAGDDAVSRQANSTGIKIPVASLLANDHVVDAAGLMSQTNLTLASVTSGTGNTVTRSGAYVLYKPTTPTDNSAPLTFTYTATDGTSSSTATVTVSLDVTAPPPFTLELIRVVSAPTFSGGKTQVTVEFAGVPNQTYQIQYSTDLASWTSVEGVNTGTTGTFEATFEASGDHSATGDNTWSNMYFRSTR